MISFSQDLEKLAELGLWDYFIYKQQCYIAAILHESKLSTAIRRVDGILEGEVTQEDIEEKITRLNYQSFLRRKTYCAI